MITLTLLQTVEKVIGERLTAKGAQFALTHLPQHKLTREVICSADYYLSTILEYPDCHRCGIPVVDDSPNPIHYHAKCLRERLADENAKDELRKADDEEIKARKAYEVTSADAEASRQELASMDESESDWWSRP